MSQIVVQIGADTDDGTDAHTGGFLWVYTNNSNDVGFASVQRDLGVRFTGITIAAGSTIDSAKLTVKEVNYNSGGSMTLTIAGWKADNPAGFDTTNHPSVVPKTTATVAWTFNSATNLNTTFDSPDIKTIIQELLNAYTMSNSAIALVASGSTSGNDAFFEDYHAGTGSSPILTINYTAGGASFQAAWAMGANRLIGGGSC